MSARLPRLTAVLGPTNTGKTHHAIDRMLDHDSGMIGFPLRLLARENYDRVVALRGRARTALVTGEEKIVPPRADYFLCTVEAMPIGREVDFLAVDEIQMCADPERGHVFTDRLLRARGRRETMFLGAASMGPLIRSLVSGIEHVSRPRLSRLSYAGPRKITRLPRRSAVVAFSVNEIYAIAELMRRRGGAAIVLGALSPRTRNAQVELYQNGDVDFLVATDAIGMGLNMGIDHVAFAGIRKFDGRAYRRLTTAETAQIAGRAGRHLADGTFGPIAEIGSFEDELVAAVEEHRFDPIAGISWRSADLDFGSVAALRRSLERPPSAPGLERGREADDQIALAHLARDPELRASSPDMVRLLWDVCRIPDFRKTTHDVHAGLLGRIFRHLSGSGRLPADWMSAQVAPLDRTDGDIDTLMARIAHVRTWTYISYRTEWIEDAETWQAKTRDLEDKLSDALHDSLTRRFVDRRAAVLMRRDAAVSGDGEVTMGGERVGRIEGFRFVADDAGVHAPADALRREIDARVAALAAAPEADFAISANGVLSWSGAAVARLTKGADILSPMIRLLPGECLSAALQETVRRCLSNWIDARISEALAPLAALRAAELRGLARGLAYRIVEGLGSVPRRSVMREVRELSREDRAALRSCGVRIGAETVFVPSLVKPAAVMWRALLWSVHANRTPLDPPAAGLVTVSANAPAGFLEACGYREIGERAVRVDVLDRIAVDLQRQSRAGKLDIGAAQLNLLGLTMDAARPVFEALGYASRDTKDGIAWKRAARPAPARQSAGRRSRQPSSDSPFAKLRELRFS